MATLNGFDANQVDPAVAYAPVPAGDYVAVMTESEMKPTKSGTGEYLQCTFQIIEGQHQGRNVWARLNLKNPNAEATRIARAELSAICHAVGVMTPKDSLELHNLPLVVKVSVKKREDNGALTNEIKGYEKRSAGAPAPAGAATSGQAPWQR